MLTSKCLALIPARGGSKRIPQKNVIDFHGKPMLAYPVETAIESGIFDRVHVSSDDESIRAIAAQYGAHIDPKRPDELADDFVGMLPVARWVLEQFRMQGHVYTDVFILFPCAPFIEVDDLKNAYDVYLQHNRKRNLLTICEVPARVEQYYRRQADGSLIPMTSGGNAIRTQDLEPAYYETGTFTIFSAEWLLQEGQLFDDTNYVSYELTPTKSADIDTLQDLERAKLLYAAQKAL